MYPTRAKNLKQNFAWAFIATAVFNSFLNNSIETNFFKSNNKVSHSWFAR